MKAIPREQVISHLATDNPWWRAPHEIPSMFSGLQPRPYLEMLLPLIEMATPQRAVVLMGPRRVGKTVLVHHGIQKLLTGGVAPNRICYTSVDHPLYNGLGIEGILASYTECTGIDYKREECYLFLDEIQYLRDWEAHLKSIVDRHPHCHCLVSGSAATALRLKSNASVAGRFTDFMLPPLTFYEYIFLLGLSEPVTGEGSSDGFLEKISVEDTEELNGYFLDYLNYGGYPEVALSRTIQADPSRFIKNDIIDKILLRDLPNLYGVQDIQELNYLFTTLAFNTAAEISPERLAQGSGVARDTLDRYIEYLEAAFLMRVVNRVDRSARRLKPANYFKVYLTNPSIHAALFSPLTDRHNMLENLVETAVLSQLFHSDEHFYYARWNKGEVNIVQLGPNQKAIAAVEVKFSDRYLKKPGELRPLIEFCREHRLTDALVTSKTQQGVKTVEGVTLRFFPASLYCYALGYAANQRRYAPAGTGAG
uniref:AAA domain-containing protein n=1 Tax=Candidatus Kentrum sp. FM TaxID=2126340 RepID=A0A450VVA4_9GAMM|nr:MAG: hypothetical protein BECKFM1743C_GA0114222_100408 [Candidatus Kentron sp. FM]VFJ50038.1 MAG: hypothetical protein BECKFM1743A_GA0114220_100793 [Candidatus Kentron sp. FM]VFK08707.1 MAG: hypothetical protein BECKFM1743B_GA0114221_100798 [Candidatus Kentron sp. FM]